MFGFGKKRNTQRIFMDYASTTPIRKEVLLAMQPFFTEKFQNPSSIYEEGVLVKKEIENARTRIARLLHVKSGDIYFTGSGTESDNMAVLGLFDRYMQDEAFAGVPHIITSTIEHPAILEACREVERRGGKVTYLPVGEKGIVRAEDVAEALTEETILVTIMYANNEIGTIQPISKIGRYMQQWKREKGRGVSDAPFLHTDASQAPLYLDCNAERLGVDMMTLDGSKIYGPKGVSVLYKKHAVLLYPRMFGGGQEGGLRPATENVPAIIGFTKAFELAVFEREKESERLQELQEYAFEKILDKIPNAQINGDTKYRLPNNVNICIPGANGEFLVIQLDEKGIACASMTACKNLDDESRSYVVEALHTSESVQSTDADCAGSSLRFTFGYDTTKGDIDALVEKLQECLK